MELNTVSLSHSLNVMFKYVHERNNSQYNRMNRNNISTIKVIFHLRTVFSLP